MIGESVSPDTFPLPFSSFGNNRGAFVAARFANFRPERTLAVGFVTVGYIPPNPNFDLEASHKKTKEVLGFEVLKYWESFTDPEFPQLVRDNVRGCLSQHTTLIHQSAHFTV